MAHTLEFSSEELLASHKVDEPLVVGEGWLTSVGALAPIKVKAQEEKDGAFTFYFSASTEQE